MPDWDIGRNMELWRDVEVSDPKMVKHVSAGGFKMSTVNAMYNIRRMTERFGPAGGDWGFEVIESRIVELGSPPDQTQREMCWFVRLQLWYYLPKTDSVIKTLHKVEHYGSAMLLTWIKPRDGRPGYWSTDEEAAKKAETNALSKCLSIIGFSADLWFDKYGEENRQEYERFAAKHAKQQADAQTAESVARMLDARLDKVIGCQNDDDREAICRWASDNAYGYDDAKADPALIANAILSGLAAISKTNLPWASFLTEAKRGTTNPSDVHDDAVPAGTGDAGVDGVDPNPRPAKADPGVSGSGGKRQKPAAGVPAAKQNAVAGNRPAGGIGRTTGNGVAGPADTGGGHRPATPEASRTRESDPGPDGGVGDERHQAGSGGEGRGRDDAKDDKIPF